MALCLVHLVRYTYEPADEVLQRIHEVLEMSHLVPGLTFEECYERSLTQAMIKRESG